MNEVWISENIIEEALLLARNMPFMMHGDVTKDTKKCYPTHTHGLANSKLPDIFINASAFGTIDGANVINIIASGLILDEKLRKKFKKNSYLELPTGVFDPDIIICMRKVPNNFLGVKKAYNEDNPSEYGYAQIYVKGDFHVLEDSYFESIP